MGKKIFFLAISSALLFGNCMKENIKKEKVGNTSLVIYDQSSLSFFSKKSLLPDCLDGVKKAGAKNVISAQGGTTDGFTGSMNTMSPGKSCSAVGVE
ncbi:MAG: hypothetical protein OEV78_07490 [Spirochaetia bacterium]|nr:hypothetical protein [Spirochaetia bacterium]